MQSSSTCAGGEDKYVVLGLGVVERSKQTTAIVGFGAAIQTGCKRDQLLSSGTSIVHHTVGVECQ